VHIALTDSAHLPYQFRKQILLPGLHRKLTHAKLMKQTVSMISISFADDHTLSNTLTKPTLV